MTKECGQKSLDSTLRPAAYQLVPLLKIMSTGLGAVLVFDGVGVGKTISSGYIMSYLSQLRKRPAMVVCPPGLIDKWYIELSSKFGLRVATLKHSEHLEVAASELSSHQSWKHPSAYILSASLLQKPIQELKDLAVVVYDEIHNYRNRETRSHENASALSGFCKYRVGLSATPINNSLEDLTSEIHVLMADHSWDSINSVVQDMWRSDKGILTKPLVTRFTKERLGIHFAKRIVKDCRTAFSEWYYNWVREVISQRNRARTDSGFLLENITLYRLASSCPRAFSRALGVPMPRPEPTEKLDTFLSRLRELDSTHIIIFCEFRETTAYLAENLSEISVFVITGDTPLFERSSTIKAFRDSDHAVLILTSVGSEGLDLQFADTVVNSVLHWNPMRLEQRIGRILIH